MRTGEKAEQQILPIQTIQTIQTVLSPSILAADYTRLGEQLNILEQSGVPYLHIDVMDGQFVPSISIGFPVIQTIRKATDMIFDVHLMITEPIRYIEEFAHSGADIITVHLEACKNVKDTLDKIRNCGCKVGLTVKPDTPIEAVYPYLKDTDMILIMTVEPGFGGQKLLPHTLEKVRRLKAYCMEQQQTTGQPMPDIEVDGGITLQNLSEVIEAGANVIVAGTAVFGGDIAKNVSGFYECFQQEIDKNNS